MTSVQPSSELFALCANIDPSTIPDLTTICNRAQRRHHAHWGRRRYQRSPDREKSIERRRRLAATGCLPPAMACHLTPSEQALARILVDEFVSRGSCEKTLDEIAARAGCCHKTAQRALRRLGNGKTGHEHIKGLNWVTVEVRPQRGKKHLPNVVRIVSREWLTWIARGGKMPRKIGGHLCPTTDTRLEDASLGAGFENEERGCPKEELPEEVVNFAGELANIAGYARDSVPAAWGEGNPPKAVGEMFGLIGSLPYSVGDATDYLRRHCEYVARKAPHRPHSPRYFLTSVRRHVAECKEAYYAAKR